MSSPVPVDTKQNKPTKFTKNKNDVPEQFDPVEKYQGITLNFGKYSGKQLKDVAVEDPNYLKWLKQRFEKDENLTPTMKAIIRFANAV
jgi:uncharacterized protein (DUF3820 family)